MNRQIRRLGVAMMVLYGAIFVQLNLVQVLRADDYNAHPANTRAVVRDFNRPRGVIQSADGAVLAQSEPTEGRFEYQRVYPEGPLFSQVTGFFSFTFGNDGVERTYNDHLAGHRIPLRTRNLVDLLLDDVRTANVTLTIPRSVQEAAAAALGERRGAVVAVDTRTGAVLALYSWPTYDPNVLSNNDQAAARAARELLLADENRPLALRAFRERYFPGSTFKVVTAAAGIESGQVSRDQPVYPPASEYVPPLTTRPIRNYGGGTCGGNLLDIMRVSCNTAFAQMAVDVGADAMTGAAEAFGFNERPPLDLPAVAASRFPDAGFFDQNTPLLAQAGIGQNEVQATPLQLALVAAGIANNGIVMTPHVMAEIRDDQGELVERFQPQPWRQAVPPDAAAVIRDSMIEVVARGTGTGMQLPGMLVAGKTGTAQIGSDPPRSHAWIMGFAPADAPRVAVAVLVEGAPGVGDITGGRVAAPIARAVLEAALAATADAEPAPGGSGQ